MHCARWGTRGQQPTPDPAYPKCARHTDPNAPDTGRSTSSVPFGAIQGEPNAINMPRSGTQNRWALCTNSLLSAQAEGDAHQGKAAAPPPRGTPVSYATPLPRCAMGTLHLSGEGVSPDRYLCFGPREVRTGAGDIPQIAVRWRPSGLNRLTEMVTAARGEGATKAVLLSQVHAIGAPLLVLSA